MRLILGDCLEKLKELESESVDAVVSDPPAGISFMGKDWDKDKGGRDNWIAWMQEIMTECNRVLKPGGHAVIWALPRTSHWTARAIEDAGFEIRDVINHIFASGFPKSLNVGKKYDQMRLEKFFKDNPEIKKQYDTAKKELKILDKKYHEKLDKHNENNDDADTWDEGTYEQTKETIELKEKIDQLEKEIRSIELQGNEREEYIDENFLKRNPKDNSDGVYESGLKDGINGAKRTKGNSKWEGFGTNLKPAYEHWILARKKLSEKTVLANCLKHGTGALDIDGCRIPISDSYEKKHLDDIARGQENATNGKFFGGKGKSQASSTDIQGRFPANIIVSDDALNDGVMTKSTNNVRKNKVPTGEKGIYNKYEAQDSFGHSDSGSKSRYFDIECWYRKLIDTSSTLLLSGFQDVAVGIGLGNSNAYTYSEYDAEQLLHNADKVWGSVFSYNSLRTYLLSNEGLCVQSLKALQDFLGDYQDSSRFCDELSRLYEGISPEFFQLLNDAHTQVRLSLQKDVLVDKSYYNDHQMPYSFFVMLIILPIIIKVAKEVNTFNQDVWGEKHGLLQFPKASKRERNEGLDCYLTVKYNGSIINNNTKLCKEENMVAVQLLQKVISEQELVNFNIDESGVNITGQCHKDSLSIILTETKRIIGLKIYSLLTHSLTNESTQVANSEMESGGNLAESVADLKRWILTTTNGNQELALGASRVVSQMLQLISEEENWKPLTNIHSTVKPVHLMSWLVRLVSKEGDTVLDPFMGSGTTGVACKKLGRNFIGIEMSEEYIKIAEARINYWEKESKQITIQLAE